MWHIICFVDYILQNRYEQVFQIIFMDMDIFFCTRVSFILVVFFVSFDEGVVFNLPLFSLIASTLFFIIKTRTVKESVVFF